MQKVCPKHVELFFSFVGGDYGTNTVHCFYHTLIVFMVHLLCSAFSDHYTKSKGFFSFKPSHQFAVVEQLDRFDVDVVEKPFFMLLSEISNFTRNHLHLKVPWRSAFLIYQGASTVFLSTLF